MLHFAIFCATCVATKLRDKLHENKLCNANRTEWSPIWSVIIRVITKSDDDLFITSMITDRIGRLEVLLSINHKNYHFREKKGQVMKERGNLLKRLTKEA